MPQSTIPDISAVCCIEHGRLEAQTILMIRSLREFGGAFANIPVMAVVGRKGPTLRPGTVAELDKLGVQVVRSPNADNPAPWLNYANKLAAVSTADRMFTTSQITWLDSDIFFLAQPKSFLLSDSIDFRARPDHLPPAVFENDQTHVPYWRRVCALFGVDFEDVPWIEAMPGCRQKATFNSGIFTWRRGEGFAENYQLFVRRLLSSRLAQASGTFFTADQVVLAPLLVALGMRWKEIDVEDHLLVLGGLIEPGPMQAPNFGKARVMHYSNSFSPMFREKMEQRIRAEKPELALWLDDAERTLRILPSSPAEWVNSTVLRLIRGGKYRLYARRVIRVR